jgi:asparagine synthase (glutamine-hydrolysing)
MCGISGICLADAGGRVDPARVQAMNDALAHRGPDGDGIFTDGPVALGHRRLSIIDLVTGDQPIFNEDRTVAIVFNGEIYNYKELRADLQARGHRLSTSSDTEVIVHLYEDFGDDCVLHLNGMFAFALWDQTNRRLLLARDRLGERPLYYHADARRIVFGSELKALLCEKDLPREVDAAAIDDYLAYGYIPAPATVFKGVHKLQAGERLAWEQGRVRTSRYWTPPFGPPVERPEAEYVEELRALLQDSVRLRLRSDVPVGAFLSGGLDSNGIVALASRELGRPLMTFSVGFGEPEFDELARARLTAKRYGTDHHEIVVKDADVSVFPELAAHYDEPFGDPSMLPTYFIAREASRFVKVCISGDAGDELFAGYPHYLEAQRYARVDAVPLGLRRAVLGPLAAMLPDHVRGKGLLRRLSATPSARYARQVGVFDALERRALLRPELAAAADGHLFEPFFSRNSLDPVSLCQWVDQQTYLPEDVLVKVDRAALKSALEVRVPFLDHRIVELVNAMPLSMKLREGTTKYVLRRTLADLVPPEILHGPKQGFGIPIRHWFRGELQGFAREMLLSPQSRSGRFLQREAVASLLEAHQRGGRDLSDRIWSLLVLEEWCRRAA